MIETTHALARLPSVGFFRLKDIVGDPKAEPPVPAIIPIARSTWLAGVREGRFPQPVKLTQSTTAWKIADIMALVERLGNGEATADPRALRASGQRKQKAAERRAQRDGDGRGAR